ncbi:MAG: NAD(P)-dependent oxidoreductase [Chloroflexota bacterium]
MTTEEKTHVLLLEDLSDELLKRFQAAADPCFDISKDQAQTDYQILIGGRLKEEVLIQNPRLHSAIIPWAGIPESYHKLLSQEKYGHIVPHNCHFHAELVAEYAYAMLLALAKDLARKDKHLRRGDWRPRYGGSRALRLVGKKVLILGYGAIGREIGRLCRLLDMDVSATRRSVAEPLADGPVTVYPGDQMTSLFPECDVLVNVLPHTPETEGVIGEAELALLKPMALLINVGRGKTIDETALYDALASRRIHGAALDVWYNYPDPKEPSTRAVTHAANLPFYELDNVLMSPHNSAALYENEHHEYRIDALAAMLNAFAATGELPNRVDLKRGY